MRNYLILFVLSSFFLGCTFNKESRVPTKKTIETTINQFLDEWHAAASNADYEAYFGKMDSISVFIGTDATENWSKKQFEKFSKPYFDQGKAWSFSAIDRNIYVNEAGNFLWFDELLDTWMGTCRGSGVLEKKQGQWKIKHYVLSIEIPNSDVQAVISVKKKSDSIFLSTLKK
jgi:ketosteroid isomerase-like protein